MGILETGCYRQGYLPGCGFFRYSWDSTAGTLLRLSNTSMDRCMVLLEQACVFWLGDNSQDRCAKKEVVSLAHAAGAGGHGGGRGQPQFTKWWAGVASS